MFDKNGNWVLNESYQEILKLDRMLSEAKIPHTLDRYMDGWQIIYQCDGKGRVMDAVEHCGSYGKERDKLEIMGLLTADEEKYDSVSGYLTAEEVFKRIKKHWGEEYEA